MMNSSQPSLYIHNHLMEAREIFPFIGWLLSDFKLTHQGPVSSPAVREHLRVIFIYMLFKKGFESIAAGFFDHLCICPAYRITTHFFNGDHDEFLFALISSPLLLFASPKNLLMAFSPFDQGVPE